MNDIPQQKNITISLYADDTAILAQGKSPHHALDPLQTYISRLETWLVRWKIKLNVEKTEAIVFFKKRNQWPKITLYDTPIDWKNEVKYLGVILDNKLNFSTHVNKAIEKYNNAFRAQYSLICRNSTLSMKNKLIIYLTYLRPIITYASPIWASTTKTNLNKLQVLENKTLRMICNAKWYFRNTEIKIALNIPPLNKFIRKISEKFYLDLPNMQNPTIDNLPIYDPYDPSFRKRPRYSTTL